jgi:pimeloyl-ACP methyl ester carboxylesterase
MSRAISRTIRANGLEFAIDELGEGDDVALLLHGFPETRHCWRHQLPSLVAAGWRAVATDMRGYGGSSRPEGRAAYGIDHLIGDVRALFEALGARRRLLVGHDWGGLVAWATAIRQSCPLDGLVILNAPHPAVFANVIRRSWRQRLRSWYVLFFALPWLPEKVLTAEHARKVGQALRTTARRPGVFPAETLARYRDNATQPGAMTAMLNYYRANLDIGAMARGPGVAVPTLLLWGDCDHALGSELVPDTGTYVPELTVRMLRGISHWVQEEAPEEVNAAIADWLRSKNLA